MPYVVTGEPTNPSAYDYSRMKFDYDYPNGLDLKPGSDFHKKIRNRVWQRARESRDEMAKRFESWRNIDRTLTTYIPLKTAEEDLQDDDPTKPVSIVFPYSYLL